MNNAVRVQIVQGMHKLLGNLPHFVFRQIPVVLQDFKQFSLSKLSNHAELMRCFEAVKQQNDVFVIQAFQNIDFLSQVV